MAKKTKDIVKISKNGKTKEVPKSQWEAMVKSKSTYGWRLASDLDKEVLNKDKQLEQTKITELEGKVKELGEENTSLKSQIQEKDTKITELEGKIKEQADLLSKHVKGTPAEQPKQEVPKKEEAKAPAAKSDKK
ncbi:hypothetical protein [Gaetbulibacter sp. PBL-D1]|uniref:hypothetical protein n=1 Tax=Gaetbulibacter sp. PBL-D1 TaxID=3422594 RepID=UPI003D2F0697